MLERFIKFVVPCPVTGCWFWIGAWDRYGYGKFSIKHHTVKAHRVSFQLFKGKIPNKYEIDHTVWDGSGGLLGMGNTELDAWVDAYLGIIRREGRCP